MSRADNTYKRKKKIDNIFNIENYLLLKTYIFVFEIA